MADFTVEEQTVSIQSLARAMREEYELAQKLRKEYGSLDAEMKFLINGTVKLAQTYTKLFDDGTKVITMIDKYDNVVQRTIRTQATLAEAEKNKTSALKRQISEVENLTSAQDVQNKRLAEEIQRRRELANLRGAEKFTSELRADPRIIGLDQSKMAAVASQINAIERQMAGAKISTEKWTQAFNAGLNGSIGKFSGEAATANAAGLRLRNTFYQAEKAAKKLNEGTKQVTLSWQSFERIILARVVTQAFHRITTALETAVRESANLMVSLAEVQTISPDIDQTADGFNRLADAAIRFSNQFGFGLDDTIEAFYDNLSNQIANSVSELEYFNEQAARLAKATNSTLEQSSNTLAAILNAYGKGISQTSDVAAQLFVTVDEGRLRLEEIANTFGRVAVPAAQLGVSLEEVNAALATTTISGIPAAEAMTLFRNVLFKLQRPTSAMKDLFLEWGVATGDIAVETLGFEEILVKLNKEAEKGSEEFGELFGRIRAFRGAIGLTGQALEDYKENLKKLGDAQLAFDKAFNVVYQNKGEQAKREINKIKNALTEDFGIPVTEIFSNLSNISDPLRDIIKYVGEFAASIVIFGSLAALLTLMLPLIKVSAIGYGLLATGLGLIGTELVIIQRRTETFFKEFEKNASDEQANIFAKKIRSIGIAFDQAEKAANNFYTPQLKALAAQSREINKFISTSKQQLDIRKQQEGLEAEILDILISGNKYQVQFVRRFEDIGKLQETYNLDLKRTNGSLDDQKGIIQEITKELEDQIKVSSDAQKSLLDQAGQDRFDRYLRNFNPIDQIGIQYNQAQKLFNQGIQLFNIDPEQGRALLKQAYDLLTTAESGAFEYGILGDPQRHAQFFESAFNTLVNANLQLEEQYKQATLQKLKEQKN